MYIQILANIEFSLAFSHVLIALAVAKKNTCHNYIVTHFVFLFVQYINMEYLGTKKQYSIVCLGLFCI